MPTLTLAPKPKKVAAESNVSTELRGVPSRSRAHGGDTFFLEDLSSFATLNAFAYNMQ